MRRFKDVHGERIHPALILRRANAPRRLESGQAAISFRYILVACTVPMAWSKNLIYANYRNRPSFSNYFRVYPWMIDRNFDHAIANTPTTLAIHEASAINGQSSPELSPINLRRSDFDDTLLHALLERWSARYVTANPTWENTALFRSLNIANQAFQIPSSVDTTIYDFGRIISMWVSSFETLIHPGATGRATLKEVYALFERVAWLDPRCGHRRYKTRLGTNSARRNIACWIYNQIYVCRNNFLHGNPVKDSDLKTRRSGRSLIMLAPPLYRLGLTSFLDLSMKGDPPPMDDADAFAEFLTRSMRFEEPQRDAERAIRKALISVGGQERQRQERLDQARARSRQIRADLNASGM